MSDTLTEAMTKVVAILSPLEADQRRRPQPDGAVVDARRLEHGMERNPHHAKSAVPRVCS